MKTLAPDQIPPARQLEELVAEQKANLKAHRSSSTCRTARLPRGGSGTQEPLAGQPERWRRCQIQTPEVALPEESVTPRAVRATAMTRAVQTPEVARPEEFVTPRAVSATATTTALTARMTSAPLHPTARTLTRDSSLPEAWLRGGGALHRFATGLLAKERFRGVALERPPAEGPCDPRRHRCLSASRPPG